MRDEFEVQAEEAQAESVEAEVPGKGAADSGETGAPDSGDQPDEEAQDGEAHDEGDAPQEDADGGDAQVDGDALGDAGDGEQDPQGEDEAEVVPEGFVTFVCEKYPRLAVYGRAGRIGQFENGRLTVDAGDAAALDEYDPAYEIRRAD